MSSKGRDLIDWRKGWLETHTGTHVALLVAVDGDFFDGSGDTSENGVAEELRNLLDNPTVRVEGIDPSTGAGGYGIGVIWELVGHGADILAYVTAAVAAAPSIRKAVKYLATRASRAAQTDVYLSGETIKALYVAELCEDGFPAASIERIEVIEHKYDPIEPATEKQQLFSAYTLTVEGRQPDGFYHVWSSLITCRGEVVGKSHARIPMPNATQWSSTGSGHQMLRALK
jgi:hypothetical protein